MRAAEFSPVRAGRPAGGTTSARTEAAPFSIIISVIAAVISRRMIMSRPAGEVERRRLGVSGAGA